MIFQPQLAKLVLQGRKSQTRRKVQPGKQPRYQAGKSYAIQPGRGKPAVGRITVTDVQLAYLGDIDLRDAKREGFATRQEFVDYWTGLHGRFDPDTRVWVISFLLGDRTDTPRLLAARPGPPSGDYVTDPHHSMPDEPEAVDEATQERLTGLGTMRWSQEQTLRESQRLRLHLHERLRELERASARSGAADVTAELRVIRERLRKLREAA